MRFRFFEAVFNIDLPQSRPEIRIHQVNVRVGVVKHSQGNFQPVSFPSRRKTASASICIDRTHGPACAIACGAGTIYRNYFADVNGQVGQTTNNQIDCLRDLGTALGNDEGRLWTMRNGYALALEEGLREISAKLSSTDDAERDDLRGLLRVGLQWATQVTLNNASHVESQVYGSALPMAYSSHSSELWSAFAQLILEASYEAAFLAGVLNAAKSGNNTMYLTLLGGGAFDNAESWIMAAIERSRRLY